MVKRLTAVFLAFSLLAFFSTACWLASASAETAAGERWGILESMFYLMNSEAVQNADLVLQRDLYTGTVNGMAFQVTEGGYDGHSLFLRYSFRIPEAKNAFGVSVRELYGEFLPEGLSQDSFEEGLTEEGNELLEAREIGWWCDQFWIDGKGVGLDGGAMQSISGSNIPGEIIETDFLPVDKSGISMSGRIRISLPIGTRPDPDEYDAEEHPEKYDADGFIILPEEGVITFELDTKDILSRVRTFHPEEGTELAGFTAKVREAVFTPLLTYITVEMNLQPGALEAFIAENGEGETDENGELIYRYGPINVFNSWLESVKPVDGNGTVLFPEKGGPQGNDEKEAEFMYPCAGELPDSLFLAPFDEETGTADMDSAVPIL